MAAVIKYTGELLTLRMQYEHIRRSGRFNMFSMRVAVSEEARRLGFKSLLRTALDQSEWFELMTIMEDPVSEEAYQEWRHFHELPDPAEG